MPRKKSDQPVQPTGEIIPQAMEEVIHTSMMTYAEHVLLERAIPRVEDGLKPVQRRILYTMNELGITPDKPHRKSARIVGDCLGKYHPHGDTSVYDAMVRMAQDFSMRAPLVDGHGNFGSIDGDSAAAMRYTEARMTPLALLLLQDIEKDTVPFSLNFDDSLKEPDLLPGRFPNLLVNGATGIAVGLATNIPPHNLGEVIDGTVAMIDNPDIDVKGLMKYIKGPDFPTGGSIIGRGELKKAYATGRGRLTVRAKVHIEDANAGKKLLVVTEVPYQVNKAAMLEKILKLSEERKGVLASISDIRDESDRTGMRAVIELKRDADPDKVLNYLYKYSDLQATFGVNMVAIVEGKPQQLGLPQVLFHYIRHQKDVVTRRTKFDLDAALRREHILQGLIIAVHNIDEVIRIIRSSRTVKEAKERLMKRFELTEVQAQAILDMRLARLTALEVEALEKELRNVQALIAKLQAILKSEKKLLQVIKEELLAVKAAYDDPRRTHIDADDEAAQIDVQQFVVVEEMTVALTRGGYMKRVPARLARPAPTEPEEDDLAFLVPTATDKRLLMITDAGLAYLMDVTAVPEAKWKDRGSPLTSFVNGYEAAERPIALFSIGEGEEGILMTVSHRGMVKKSLLAEYNGRKGRFAAMALKGEDRIIYAARADAAKTLLLITRKGMSIHFSHEGISVTGRATGGVKGITLDLGDRVLWAIQTDMEGELAIASDRGYVKRSLLVDYELQGRGGKGLKTFDFKKNGSNGAEIVAVDPVTEPYDLYYVTKDGAVTKLNTEDIPIEPRLSKGSPLVLAVLTNTLVRSFRLV